MCATDTFSIREHFASLPEPRIDRQKRHDLIDIVSITICAVIAGAEAWTDVEAFGKAKEPWFRSFLELPNGIPSHDTFGRFFSLLDPQAFQKALGAALLKRPSPTSFQGLEQGFPSPFYDFAAVHHATSCSNSGIGARG